jgi:phosphatidylinositol alpha 1,6-mannosyltransferase
MASGLPVVAPARGGVLDTVRPGETGLLFEPGSVRDLVEKTLSLIEAPDRRRALGIKARAAAEARSWTSVFDRLFSDYRDALRLRNSPVTGPPQDRTTVSAILE